jgi:hypothetical protein
MKKVIYTVLTNGYDSLKQPKNIREDFTYICFSNDIQEKKVGIWKIRKIPYKTKNSHYLSRYPKIYPHKLLSKFDISIYIDANIVIKGDLIYRRVDELVEKEVVWAGIKHPWRDCIYKEGYVVVRLLKEKSLFKIISQLVWYKLKGFPEHFGMYEANCIFRRHNDRLVRKQSKLWWKLIHIFSQRDQMALSYTLWRYNFPFIFILPNDYNVRNHPDFKYIDHIKSKEIRPINYDKKMRNLRRVYNHLLKISYE